MHPYISSSSTKLAWRNPAFRADAGCIADEGVSTLLPGKLHRREASAFAPSMDPPCRQKRRQPGDERIWDDDRQIAFVNKLHIREFIAIGDNEAKDTKRELSAGSPISIGEICARVTLG
jgi:hypothetical protein